MGWLSERPTEVTTIWPDCPIRVAARHVPSVRKADKTERFATGWGRTAGEASYRCMLEVAERLSGQFHGTEAVMRAPAESLAGHGVPIPSLLMISDAQYATRRQWNLEHKGFNYIPRRWQPGRAIDWILSAPKLGTAQRWLPAGLCFLGHGRDRVAGLPPADSSGVAAGSSLEDAVLRGFCELVERDAIAIWWYNRLPRPRLALPAVEEPVVQDYARWSRLRSRHLHLQDLSSDFGIRVIAAISHDDSGKQIAMGFGAQSSAAEAAAHAVGELAQFEVNLALMEKLVGAGAESKLTPEAKALFRWRRDTSAAGHPHLIGGTVTARELPEKKLDLAGVHQLCRSRNLDLLVLDQTRPSVGFPVVRVLVPGLRPKWARFAPGRLYDVPVQMGWRRSATAPDQLNSSPLMF